MGIGRLTDLRVHFRDYVTLHLEDFRIFRSVSWSNGLNTNIQYDS